MIWKWEWMGKRRGGGKTGGRGGKGERKAVLALLDFNRWTDAALFSPLSLRVQLVYLIFSQLRAVCAASELVP